MRVAASLDEIHASVATMAQEVEQRDEEAVLGELVTAFGTGSAILGLKAVLSALSQGRVERLLISSGFMSQPGAVCPSCQALWSAQPACDSAAPQPNPLTTSCSLRSSGRSAPERNAVSFVRTRLPQPPTASPPSPGTDAGRAVTVAMSTDIRRPTRLAVSDVMTRDAITVAPDADFKQIERLLAQHHVGAFPVVDAEGRPLGVVSETDLVLKTEAALAAPAGIGARRAVSAQRRRRQPPRC